MESDSYFKIIETIAVIIAAVVAIYGISSWRREAKWKRKYELAEEVLSCLYEISETFDMMRNPCGYVGEGKTRKRRDGESQEESDILDKAYVLVERYEKNKEPFIKLQSLKYQFMALYGNETKEYFNEIMQLRNQLFHASHMLGTRYWKDQGRRKMTEQQEKQHLGKMDKFERLFWSDFEEKDEFNESMDSCINKIEKRCWEIIKKGH
jgi:hypothetical protein